MSERATGIAVRCRECGTDYSQRENLLTGEWLWFANCQCEFKRRRGDRAVPADNHRSDKLEDECKRT